MAYQKVDFASCNVTITETAPEIRLNYSSDFRSLTIDF